MSKQQRAGHGGGQGQGLLGAPLRTLISMVIVAYAMAFAIDYLYPNLSLPLRARVDDFARAGVGKLADTIIKITE